MRIIASLLLLAALLSGCSGGDGGDDSSSQTSTTGSNSTNGTVDAPETVTLTASAEGLYPANPRLSPATMSVPANATVILTFTNNDPNPAVSHNWVLEGVAEAASASVGRGQSTELNFTAPAPGSYAFFCSIGDHRARGMQGTLTVE